MRKIRYEDLTWPQIQEAAKQNTIIVQPIAAIEQHGPHLPLSTDTCQTNAVAIRAVEMAAKEVPVLLAPTIPWGFSTLQMDLPGDKDRYPGTLSIKTTTLMTLVGELCYCFVRAGFRRIILLNGHGGNYQPLQVAARDIRDVTGAIIAVAPFYTLAPTEEMLPFIEEGTIKHAAEWETSLMLAIDEKNVDKERIVRDPKAVHAVHVKTKYAARDELGGKQFGTKVMFAEKNVDYSINGVVGDPSLATKDKGEKLLEIHARSVKEFIVEFSTWEFGKI